MLVVHGVWAGDALAFWAEDTDGTSQSAGAPAGGTTSGATTHPATETTAGTAQQAVGTAAGVVVRPHPFAATAAALGDLLGLLPDPDVALHDHASSAGNPALGDPPGLAPDSAITLRDHAASTEGLREAFTERQPADRLPPVPLGGSVRGLRLMLPGSAKEPLASPEAGRLSAVARPRLHLWEVPAVVPATDDALRVLAEHPGAATVRHWGVVAEFARDLVRRGRVIPQLIPQNRQHSREADGRAVWRAVLTGADAAYFRDLALAMPPACRTSEIERPSVEVLGAALDAFADALVRASLTEPLVTAPRTGQERWLAALTGADDSCPDSPELRRELEEWRASVAAADGAARVCFRLLEPTADLERLDGTAPISADHLDRLGGTAPPPADDLDRLDDTAGTVNTAGTTGTDDDDARGWRVEIALQAADDPSLYVRAERVWSGEPVPGLPRSPERELLAGLGRAVRLYPDLDRALRVAEPTGLELDTAGAFEFLRQAAPLLQAAGFGVQLPRWAGRTRLGLKLTTRTKKQSAATAQGFGLRELVDFRIDLAVGGETISEAELAELARLKVPLVRVRGQWVELDDRQLKAALKAVGGERTGELPAAELLRHVVQGDDELPLLEVDADGVLGDLLSGQAERRLQPMATPSGLDATLRPYQERGLAWLSFLSELGLGGVLADDMGLGKTVTTLALLVHERAGTPTLLVCPMSLVGNWEREAARFAPGLRVYVHHGSGRDAQAIGDADLVITTYGTAQRDLETLRQVEWRRVVCDEAQAIKNSGTLQSQAVRAIPTGTRLALTGTPVENHLAELWSIMEFANPGLLGPRSRFRTRFQEPIEARQDEQAMRALKRATGPFVLRRVKTDKSIISDLPEKMEVKEWCPLTPEQASLYQAVVDDMLGRIDDSEGIERRGLVLAAMARLKQVCNHPAHLLKDGSLLSGRSGKLARLEQLAEEIVAEGEKALVFTQYAEFGTMLQPYLAQRLDRPVLWLHGGLPKKTRDRLVERFQHDDEPMLFLLSLKAAGVGLNLTAANHVIHVDRWWNPAVEDQATDRAFRIGQRKNVQVRKLICAGTLEERVDEMIERKKALAESVVGTGEDWLTDLSTGELREVFRLTAEAVS
ncbi:DEAD/DEAH box helicase [Nonomuraea aurantiaca]|uniref:DEAD/DEAH box helicase n=1 Tax=Nonomuraea aurantiaca TaxID=2878562 RepID=UPI001CD9B0C4|nr:DEAD/DEAH box helicase [Nonomuraea aurantiaca]MCA2220609.1 DEAD/DEAH box helicase [Nonomuraea aurantiaca]